MWGAALGAALGTGLDTGINAALANEQFQRSKYVSNRQMASARFLAQEQPGWAMEGLRKAGLNPILAASRGFPSAEFAPSSPGPSVPGSRFHDVAGTAVQLKRLSPEMRLLEEQIGRTENEKKSAFYDIGYSESRAEAEYQRMQQMEELVKLVKEQQDATAAQARSSRANAFLLEQEAAGAKALNDLYTKYPELRVMSLPGAAGYTGGALKLFERIPDAKWKE